MSRMNKERPNDCPIAFGTDIFGDRWTLLVLRDMIIRGKRRYGEFLESDEKIATNILADRLCHLENEGLVTKARDPENRRSYIYSLTPKALDLIPVIFEIMIWGGKQKPVNKRRRDLIHRMQNDRAALIAEIYQREGMTPP